MPDSGPFADPRFPFPSQRRGYGDSERPSRSRSRIQRGIEHPLSTSLVDQQSATGTRPANGVAATFGASSGRIAQRESARFTRERSLVRSQVRPSANVLQPSDFPLCWRAGQTSPAR